MFLSKPEFLNFVLSLADIANVLHFIFDKAIFPAFCKILEENIEKSGVQLFAIKIFLKTTLPVTYFSQELLAIPYSCHSSRISQPNGVLFCSHLQPYSPFNNMLLETRSHYLQFTNPENQPRPFLLSGPFPLISLVLNQVSIYLKYKNLILS